MNRRAASGSQSIEPICWPAAKRSIVVPDKVTGQSCVVNLDQDEWHFTDSGKPRTLRFAPGRTGLVQRTALMHITGHLSGSSIYQVGRNLIEHWNLHTDLLRGGPKLLERRWESEALSAITSRTAKSLLRAACHMSVGAWYPKHLDFVVSLEFHGLRDNSKLIVQDRLDLVAIEDQAKVVAILDEAAIDATLSDRALEAMATVALALQHGMRPVQLLALRLEHVSCYTEASGSPGAVLSFHAAKRSGGEMVELLRPVKPEWASIVCRLYDSARRASRDRLFAAEHSTSLWGRVRKEFGARGAFIEFSQKSLRHTGAQSLADAGHTRLSIQKFLGHASKYSADSYIRASAAQSHVLNAALGASKIYKNIVHLANRRFVSVEEIEAAGEPGQIGAIVGTRAVTGIGLCATGQPACPYNPVSSCYGCRKFIPSLDRATHVEAIEGMREQVLLFVDRTNQSSAAFRQLTTALSLAQATVAKLDAAGPETL